MRTIENPAEFRKNIATKLKEILNNEDKLGLNLEKGIYNYCIKEADDKNIVKKWDNVYFVQLYIDRLRTIYFNLKNEELKQRLLSKSIKVHEFAFMTHQEMAPQKWKKLIEEKKVRDEIRYAPKVEASTDNFTCRKCKSKECTYYQLQTRSADEPMTTFVTCIPCGARWKC
jgi:transcription elongation factor S-II